MPKLLEGIREKIIEEAKNELLQTGYNSLHVRSIAKKVGIASGTIYNYFPSKDILVASILLDDWKVSLIRAEKNIESASSYIEGYEMIYEEIKSFVSIFSTMWENASFSSGIWRERGHVLLIEQVARIVNKVSERFAKERIENSDFFIAEVLMIVATREDYDFGMVKPFIEKIIN